MVGTSYAVEKEVQPTVLSGFCAAEEVYMQQKKNLLYAFYYPVDFIIKFSTYHDLL